MPLALRHRSSAPAIRGQHPAWQVLLSWVAMLALLLGSGLWVADVSSSALTSSLHASPQEHPGGSPAGGETAPEEETPAKPQRLTGSRSQSNAGARAALPVLIRWISLQSQTPPSRFAAVVETRSDPWPTLPGRRVQRGQAPPRA